jgi:hypothetical protein
MSISFPFWFILIPYGIVIVIVAVIALLALHHLRSYGASRWVGSFVTASYFVGTVIILLATASLLRGTDWTAAVSFAPTFFGAESSVSGDNPLLP